MLYKARKMDQDQASGGGRLGFGLSCCQNPQVISQAIVITQGVYVAPLIDR